MSNKKIVACLDILDGRVVKGVHFENIVDAADPIEAAIAYQEQGADELVLLDISATSEGRGIMIPLIKSISSAVHIPITAGGGIRTLEDFERVKKAGAKKISIGSAAVQNPSLITQAALLLGSSSVCVAIDAKRQPDGTYNVYTQGGKKDSGLKAVEWAKQCEDLGAGCILLTSMDADGTKQGFDIELTASVKKALSIPVTASGGAGSIEDFYEVFTKTDVDAALGASLFHFNIVSIQQLKQELKDRGIAVI